MKIDAIIGNPPYQVMDGGGTGTGAVAIYNSFVSLSKDIKPHYISLITPARWYTGGKGLDNFRKSMLQDRRIKLMFDYPNPKECFPNTNISGGVCYFLWDKNYDGLCTFENIIKGERIRQQRNLNEYEIFIRYNTALSIVHKVVNHSCFSSLSDLVCARNVFGLDSAFRGVQSSDAKHNIQIYSSGGLGWIDRESISTGKSIISKYKVFMGKVLSGHLGEADKHGAVKVITTIYPAKPDEVCTDSYLVIGNFATQQESLNLVAYLKTKTLRYLLLQALASMNISRGNFRFVPTLNFTQSWTDEMLYEYFNFTQSEIATIEQTIQPID